MTPYEELMSIDSFDDRFRYLQMHQKVGEETFGFDRYLNQSFYKSREWQSIRSFVISRDNGYDMGCSDHPITGRIYVHHIIPLTKEDIELSTDRLLDPNNLISVSMDTHNAIHYGDEKILHKYDMADRSPNDTSPWLK